MTNIELAEKALSVALDPDHYTYVQGGLFETADSKRIKGLYEYYRKVGNKSTCDYPEWLKTHGTAPDGKPKLCTDCSNFIQALLGTGKNASTWVYANLPAFPDMYTAPVGSVLYMNGHVGIVVKQGIRNTDGSWKVKPESVDFYAYNKPPRLGCYLGSYFTKAVKLSDVVYTDQPTPPTAPIPTTIKASVIVDKKLGDTLEAKDFKIQVIMSDGSVKVNPPYWTATPLHLTPDVKEIVVKYQNVSTTIPVKYVAKFD